MAENKKEKTLEESFSELDDIIEKMEEGDLPLEETFELYKKGMEAVRECGTKIDAVEKQVKVLTEEGDFTDLPPMES
ncbi:MAG: exodeoxyribonuclease VII small subunit [Lachnospiraceae bacterium]|nr:exodeoxyribonuclease VII small subunit [Lachnospiraceae bacterium]